ncbi:Acid phosphatase [Handroanthus impetiginosus]|uniref:Acid phosphatase n=1 Tax=Handroanthus impetiginosus TaxID=429701 RepID=A0A2G9GY06_9LAMI|nr:Acid phosphatase [Handroanthus impetiginosus]
MIPNHPLPGMRSRFNYEDGILMKSLYAVVYFCMFALALVSISGLIVVIVMKIKYRERLTAEALEKYRNPSYDYCRHLAFHAEMNSLSADVFPATICKDINTWYVKEGQYRRDLNITVRIAEDFFSSVRKKNDSRDVVLMDADDFLTMKTFDTNRMIYRIKEDDADYLKHIFAMKLYLKLQSSRWPLILFTRKPEKLRNATVEHLTSMGCHGWSSLIMRKDNKMNFQEYLSRERSMLQRQGLRIIAVISSHMDALRGPFLGNHVFKLPNPIFRNHDDESRTHLE